jgi:hypothetical protein
MLTLVDSTSQEKDKEKTSKLVIHMILVTVLGVAMFKLTYALSDLLAMVAENCK